MLPRPEAEQAEPFTLQRTTGAFPKHQREGGKKQRNPVAALCHCCFIVVLCPRLFLFLGGGRGELHCVRRQLQQIKRLASQLRNNKQERSIVSNNTDARKCQRDVRELLRRNSGAVQGGGGDCGLPGCPAATCRGRKPSRCHMGGAPTTCKADAGMLVSNQSD